MEFRIRIQCCPRQASKAFSSGLSGFHIQDVPKISREIRRCWNQNKNDELAAIFETVLGHINLKIRKVVNFPEDKMDHLIKVCKEQADISKPPFDVKLHIKSINE